MTRLPVSLVQNLTRYRSLVLLALAMLGLGWGCKKDQPANPQPTNAKLELAFEAESMGDKFEFGQAVMWSNQRAFIPEVLHMYCSQLELVKTDGQVVALKDVAFMDFSGGKNKNQHESVVQYDFDVPAGEYRSLRFRVGLDSATNHSDPTLYSSDHPLSVINGMHWNWKQGYIFWKLEGRVDTSAAGGQAATGPLAYHIGLQTLARQVEIPLANVGMGIKLNGGQKKHLDVKMDIARIAGGPESWVDLRREIFTHSTGSGFALAERLANRFPSSFRVVE
jgi:hypothetical protein